LVLIPSFFPTPNNVRLRRAVKNFNSIVEEFIRQRRSGTKNSNDLLSTLLHVRDDDGSSMTDRQLRDEAVTLFLAGHETTANALAWSWYLLSLHPSVEARLAHEIETELGDKAVTVEDLAKLKYTENVVAEVLRLYPPAYFLNREAINEFRLGNYLIPAGTIFLLSQWVTHRDPRLFYNPEEFIPDRWANGLAKSLPKCAYFPFGAGPRTCIGSSFALMESVLVLATIAQRFCFTADATRHIEPWPSITLRPSRGIKVTLKERRH
jgi:cytochrome P450